MITGLLGYPHGCGEQTSAKLKGLSYAHMIVSKGRITGGGGGYFDNLDDMITQGLNRMHNNYYNEVSGSLGIWNSNGDIRSTAKILKNLFI